MENEELNQQNTITTDAIKPEETNINSIIIKDYKKFKILIAACFLFFIAIFAILLFSENKTAKKITTMSSSPAPEKTKISSKGFIIIEPSLLSLPDNSTLTTAYITLDAGDISVSQVEFDVEYETGAIGNFNIKAYSDPTSALSNSLQIVANDYDPLRGVSHLKYSLKQGNYEQKGSGKLAVVTFNTKVIPEYTFIKITNASFSYKPSGAIYTPEITPLKINSTVKR